MTLFDRWSAALDELRAQNRFRELTLPAGFDLTSNDYLGYASCSPGPLPDWPRSGTASRLLRGHHPIWEAVEAALARWHGAETALVLSSGYLANQGLLAAVIEPHDWVASDERNHASLIDGIRLARAEKFIYRHLDLNHLADGLRAADRHRSPNRQLFVVTESLYSMDGDRAPLAQMVALAERYGAFVIVDEAHATGCFGLQGPGLVDEAGVRERLLATVHTGGKALAVPGAYLCGPSRLREWLINRCRPFVFSTALPPLVGAWWLKALEQVCSDQPGRDRLHANAALFRAELTRRGVPASGRDYIVPVILGDDAHAVQAAAELRRRGWDVRAIRPPSVPPGTARLRLSIHADHPPSALLNAAAALAEVVTALLR